MFETLVAPFDGMEDYQPMHHIMYSSNFDGHETVTEEYLNTLFTNQLANCSRFLNEVITEAGICKNDIIELNEAGLL